MTMLQVYIKIIYSWNKKENTARSVDRDHWKNLKSHTKPVPSALHTFKTWQWGEEERRGALVDQVEDNLKD
mgnify:CR=1 FL=1